MDKMAESGFVEAVLERHEEMGLCQSRVNAVILAERHSGKISSRGELRSLVIQFVVQQSKTTVATAYTILLLSFPIKNILLGSLISWITITLGQL